MAEIKETELLKGLQVLLKSFTVKSKLKEVNIGDKQTDARFRVIKDAGVLLAIIKNGAREETSEKISNEKARKMLYALRKEGTKIFSVRFIKKDGSVRDMTCRFGVTSHLKGGELAYKPADYDLIGVFDMNAPSKDPDVDEKGAYRSINLQTLQMLKVDGKSYLIGK